MFKMIDQVLPWLPLMTTVLVLVAVLVRHSKKLLRYVVLVAILQTATFLASLWVSYLHARTNDVQKYFYPPYGHSYLIKALHAFAGVYSAWITAAILGILLYVIFLRRTGGQFLDRRDVWLMVLGTVAVGWPGIFVFLAYVFLISVLGMITLVIFKKKTLQDRLIVSPYIIPAALLTLVTGPYILAVTHLDKIRF